MSLIKPGSLVFDIGAHVGAVSQQFLEAGADTVIAVEPCIENYMAIINRYGMDDRIVPVHAACWHESRIIGVNYAINQPGLSSAQPSKWSKIYPDIQWGKTEYVSTVTLSQLMKMFGIPHLLKIDVEGSELPVLKGLNHKTPYLMFEFHIKFQEEAIKCLQLCQKYGYRRAHYVRDNIDLDTEPTTPINEFIPRWQADAPEWGNFTLS